jgi:uncharacterized membrane protein
MRILAVYFSALAAFLLLDGIWLGVVSADFYAQNLGYLMRNEVKLGAAGLFYLFYVAGVLHFVSLREARLGTLKSTIVSGAFLGLLAYGTYDLTNYATVRDWPFIVVLVDMVWGAFVTAATSVAGYLAAKKILSQ